MQNNVIDLSKFKAYYDQLADIQKVVDKLITKQNADVYNKIGTKTEILFNSISKIDVKSAPVEDIRTLIDLLKKLRETCITLSEYKKYLETIISSTINTFSTSEQIQVSPRQESSIIPIESVVSQAQQVDKNKSLELINNEGNVA